MINILQINVARSKVVTAELRSFVDSNPVDVICVREPYMSRGRPRSFLSGIRYYCTGISPMVVTIVCNSRMLAIGIAFFFD